MGLFFTTSLACCDSWKLRNHIRPDLFELSYMHHILWVCIWSSKQHCMDLNDLGFKINNKLIMLYRNESGLWNTSPVMHLPAFPTNTSGDWTACIYSLGDCSPLFPLAFFLETSVGDFFKNLSNGWQRTRIPLWHISTAADYVCYCRYICQMCHMTAASC